MMTEGTSKKLDLSGLPPIFILPTHLQDEELHEAEDKLHRHGGQLSYHAVEARIFLGRIQHKKRAAFDLRVKGVWTEEDRLSSTATPTKRNRGNELSSPIVLSDSDTVSEEEPNNIRPGNKRKRAKSDPDPSIPSLKDHVLVLKLEWLDESVKQNKLLTFKPYLVYVGRVVSQPSSDPPSTPSKNKITYIKAVPDNNHSSPQTPQYPSSNLNTALSETKHRATTTSTVLFHRRRFGQRSPILAHKSNPPKLQRATTSEYEEVSEHELPPVPSWMLDEHPRPLYSCLRSTPSANPNTYFIAQLTKIKNARLLTLDEIGVRAYSTSIAALSAYPHRITSPMEVTRLPGCDQKIASLWIEWRNSMSLSSTQSETDVDVKRTKIGNGRNENADAEEDVALDSRRVIAIVEDLDQDKDMQILNLFHEIWGVGPDTARKFYFQHGFKDLDDLVEFHWKGLTRVQQIGVKYYDEFQVKIPRSEVESISKVILQSARRVRGIPEECWSRRHNDINDQSEPIWPWDDPHGTHTHPQDFIAVIVGGYRRGKAESGDVDVILSHRDENMTHDLVVDVVHDLETQGYITHTLTLHTTTSDRGGGTLPYRAQGHAGHGFDSLDKALCVWQDPSFDTPTTAPHNIKNPNIHRRVDIIVSSWKTIGCAVVGWSGGTTYQRDVRRWVKREKGWKFDSSGIRDRRDGKVLDLEKEVPGETDGWADRERRLMEGMGIGWREPELRCTG